MNIGDVVEIIEGEHKGKFGIFEDVVWRGYASIRVEIDGEHTSFDIPLGYLKKQKLNVYI